jgi:hypothetical protein
LYQLCTKDRKDVFLTKNGPLFKLKVGKPLAVVMLLRQATGHAPRLEPVDISGVLEVIEIKDFKTSDVVFFKLIFFLCRTV